MRNPKRVEQHCFQPFLEYKIEERKFKKYLEMMEKIESGEDVSNCAINKDRPIKYAAHVDAQIFSYYRYLLAKRYEHHLLSLKLGDNVIAYRKIPLASDPKKGKCNIHFAKEAFDEIVRRRNAAVMTLDVSKFFESLEHAFLFQQWKALLEKDDLPPDHKKVFGVITNYQVVDHDACYEKLGLIENKNGRKRFLHSPFHIYRKRKTLCSKKEYRQLIVGSGLVKRNNYQGTDIPQGIPQGSPISDILANLYMLDFDKEMQALEKSYGAYYRRYSDDIIWICNKEDAAAIEKATKDAIYKQGSTLKINDKKTTRSFFEELKHSGDKLSYLGFSFDGKQAMLRDSTISRLKRNSSYKIRSLVEDSLLNEKGEKILDAYVNVGQIFHKVSFPNKKYIAEQKERNEQTEGKPEKLELNFTNYYLRALKIFNSDKNRVYGLSDRALRQHKKFVHKKIRKEKEKIA